SLQPNALEPGGNAPADAVPGQAGSTATARPTTIQPQTRSCRNRDCSPRFQVTPSNADALCRPRTRPLGGEIAPTPTIQSWTLPVGPSAHRAISCQRQQRPYSAAVPPY